MHDVAAYGESVSLCLGAWALPGFGVAAIVCIIVAFVRERPQPKDSFVEQFRGRARYLRWLSMSCLAVMGAMLTAALRATHAVKPSELGPIAVFGLVAAVLASVYRYIVRLAYFYEARGDAFELLGFTGATGERPIGSKETRDCAALLSLLSPDKIEYPNTVEAFRKTAEMLAKKGSE